MTDPANSTLTSASDQLLSLLTDSEDLDAFLESVVALAGRVVTPAAACGLTTRRDGKPFTAASSNALAAQVDEIQYGADEGPCLETLRTGKTVQVDDLIIEQRWPLYRPHAVAHGVVSSLSLPLDVQGQTVAALNLYSDRREAFDGDPHQHAAVFAAQCAAALTLILRQTDHVRVREQLGAAMVSRSIIDQAIGVLMGQQRCGATEAFDLLRQASQHRNRKLRDVATDIIVNITGQAPQPPVDFSVTDPR